MMITAGKKTPTLIDICNKVVPFWASKWRQLGVQLKITNHMMDIIEHDYRNDCERCCTEMLTKWLDYDYTASWGDLITAVDNLSYHGMIIIQWILTYLNFIYLNTQLIVIFSIKVVFFANVRFMCSNSICQWASAI